jgi:3-hydroxyacyl-CoA dehydrogenase
LVADNLGTYCAQNGTLPGKVHFTTSLVDAVRDSWLVIEAVPEDLEVKISVLGRIDRTAPRDCIIATNSASFRSRELVSEVQHRERVLNTLYYIPPANKCVELMSCGYTAPNIFPFLISQMEDVGLQPMLVHNESTGMIFPRIFGAMKREVLQILQERVASPEDVDELFKDFFHAEKGICEKMDDVGLDTVARTEEHFLAQGREGGFDGGLEGWEELNTDYLEWLRTEYIEKGKLGEKSGEGLVLKKKDGVVKKENAEQEVWRDHSLDLSGM